MSEHQPQRSERSLRDRLAQIADMIDLGKKHALKKFDQFALNASCFWELPKLCNFTKFLLQK